MPPKKKASSDKSFRTLTDMIDYFHNNILAMNQSKIFAGLIIIVLNISSKFVTFKLSKSMEGYLKYTFSRNVLVFAMAWMGTRDIYTALFMTLLFILFASFLFNEDSMFCCLPESFKDHHTSLVDEPPETPKISEQQIADAVAVLANAKKQKDEEKTQLNGAKPATVIR